MHDLDVTSLNGLTILYMTLTPFPYMENNK